MGKWILTRFVAAFICGISDQIQTFEIDIMSYTSALHCINNELI